MHCFWPKTQIVYFRSHFLNPKTRGRPPLPTRVLVLITTHKVVLLRTTNNTAEHFLVGLWNGQTSWDAPPCRGNNWQRCGRRSSDGREGTLTWIMVPFFFWVPWTHLLYLASQEPSNTFFLSVEVFSSNKSKHQRDCLALPCSIISAAWTAPVNFVIVVRSSFFWVEQVLVC